MGVGSGVDVGEGVAVGLCVGVGLGVEVGDRVGVGTGIGAGNASIVACTAKPMVASISGVGSPSSSAGLADGNTAKQPKTSVNGAVRRRNRTRLRLLHKNFMASPAHTISPSAPYFKSVNS